MELYNPIGIFVLAAIVGFALIKFIIWQLFPDDCDKGWKRTEPITDKNRKLFEPLLNRK